MVDTIIGIIGPPIYSVYNRTSEISLCISRQSGRMTEKKPGI